MTSPMQIQPGGHVVGGEVGLPKMLFVLPVVGGKVHPRKCPAAVGARVDGGAVGGSGGP